MPVDDASSSDGDLVVRFAAKGDGVTIDGRHIAGVVPGDWVAPDGTIEAGRHHVAPPCRHFERCGGCQLQHADEQALAEFVHARVEGAARGQGLAIGEMLPTHLSPHRSRRRATLHGLRTAKGAVLGFREGGSHRIVDMHECPVLDPALFALVAPLRAFIADHGGKAGIDVALATCDQGVDVGLSHLPLDNLSATEAALSFAQAHDLARLTVDQGYGPEGVWEPEPATISLSGVPVTLPPGAFLQATPDAEARMTGDACEWLDGANKIVDLFSGLGTFAFALARGAGRDRKLLAVEADQATHRAAQEAFRFASPRMNAALYAIHRDLFRNPLQAGELGNFDAVVLDPPRAGAKAQIAQIAASSIERVVYVSCNPSSWARDAATLAEAGYALERLRPIGQFRWSTHVELSSLFVRR
ncbi:MAG: class I SAM-dependent RNA methyltransferase [Erythrobacter sp.]